jgi:NADH-quinone oxidoreductase subunit E
VLTERERAEIEAEVTQYPYRRAATVDALKVVQRHRGWVSDEALADVAACLGVSPDEVDGVATFYNLVFRQPVGRHVILWCNSVSCWVMGGSRLCAALRERLRVDLGGTSADGQFTLLPNVCLGACDGAPALMVDEDLHLRVTPDALGGLLEKYAPAGGR